MPNYNDDTLTAQLYPGPLHKIHESMNMERKKEEFKTDKLMSTKKEDEGSRVSDEENICQRINTLLSVIDTKRDTGTLLRPSLHYYPEFCRTRNNDLKLQWGKRGF